MMVLCTGVMATVRKRNQQILGTSETQDEDQGDKLGLGGRVA